MKFKYRILVNEDKTKFKPQVKKRFTFRWEDLHKTNKVEFFYEILDDKATLMGSSIVCDQALDAQQACQKHANYWKKRYPVWSVFVDGL